MDTNTNGNGTIGRWVMATALVAVVGMAAAAPAAAQYRVRSAQPAGSTWHSDGNPQQSRGGYARTGLRSVRPYPNVPQIVDVYDGQTWMQRLDYREPGWVLVLSAGVQAPLSWLKFPANQSPTAQNSYFLYNNQHWLTMAQLQAMSGQPAGQPSQGQICGDGINNQMACLGGTGTTPVITHGGDAGVGGQYVLGGNTAASQRSETQAYVDAQLAASKQRIIDRLLAPACQSSYYGCR